MSPESGSFGEHSRLACLFAQPGHLDGKRGLLTECFGEA